MTTDSSPRIELRVLDRRLEAWGLPRYHSEMAAAVDLHACLDATLVLAPGSRAELVRSGVAIHIGDANIAAVILPRSGLGHRQGLVVGNLLGLIDADYQGELMVSLWNRNAPGTEPIRVEPGDRIAQMMFVPVVRPTFQVVEEFSHASARQAGGFGSTGLG
jgi:dUTP pyrophosphatase